METEGYFPFVKEKKGFKRDQGQVLKLQFSSLRKSKSKRAKCSCFISPKIPLSKPDFVNTFSSIIDLFRVKPLD